MVKKYIKVTYQELWAEDVADKIVFSGEPKYSIFEAKVQEPVPERKIVDNNVILTINKKPYRCDNMVSADGMQRRCNCNVFTKYADGSYKCHSCGQEIIEDMGD